MTEEMMKAVVAAAVEAAMTAMTSNEVTMTPKASKSSAEPRKEYRRVRTNRLGEFGDAIGIDLSGWTLEEVLESILDSGKGTLPKKLATELPEGWVWGPKPQYFLANGRWPN